MLEITLAVLILVGAGFTFIGSLGLARMPDFYTRLHGPTKATTIGVGSLLIASMIHFSTQDDGLSFHEVLVTLFLFITAPVSAHLLSKAALHLRTRSLSEPPPLIDATDQDALTSELANKAPNFVIGVQNFHDERGP
ncbi:MAG: Na+/H+ antiporter subunit G [Chromatiales bacterium]|nr:Na+/H+ antiporter subunit G [Chromatiales bacterium]